MLDYGCLCPYLSTWLLHHNVESATVQVAAKFRMAAIEKNAHRFYTSKSGNEIGKYAKGFASVRLLNTDAGKKNFLNK